MVAKRWTVCFTALLGACAIAACGSSGTPVTRTITVVHTITSPPSTNTGTTATNTGTSTTAQTSACVAADLTPSFLGTNGAAGTIAIGFALKNTSSAPCHTYGWPGVEFLSSTGVGLATNAVRTSSDMLGSTPPSEITLKPGQEASFRMVASDFSQSANTSCPNASELQIIAPDDTATMVVAISVGIPACGKATVSPLMAGSAAWTTP